MKCPGQDTRYWKEDAIFEVRCPECGTMVEFFKDDVSRPCPGCGRRLPNPRMDFGCAAYCPYAEQCLGSLPPELREQQYQIFKDRLKAEIWARFKDAPVILERMQKRERFAEMIALEEGGRLPVVLAASYLFEMREEAEKILKGLRAPAELLQEILMTLRGAETKEAAILHDAQLLTLKPSQKDLSAPFKTNTGKRLSRGL